MQSQEEEVKMILSLFWRLIMSQFVKEPSLLLGEREELRKWILVSLMKRSPKIILRRKELPFLQFSEERCTVYNFISFLHFHLHKPTPWNIFFWHLHFPCNDQQLSQ